MSAPDDHDGLDPELQERIEAMAHSAYHGQAQGENYNHDGDEQEAEEEMTVSNHGEEEELALSNHEQDDEKSEEEEEEKEEGVRVKTMEAPACFATKTGPTVEVGEGEKVGEGFTSDAHVSYQVTTTTTALGEGGWRVRRRFRDWCWLRGALEGERQAGAILPPLPGKHRADYRDRFSPDFIRRRQAALQRHLRRLLAHPQLAEQPCLTAFLSADLLPTAGLGGEHEGGQSPVMAALTADWSWLERVGAALFHRPQSLLLGTERGGGCGQASADREERFVHLEAQLSQTTRSLKEIDGAMQRLCRSLNAEAAAAGTGWAALSTALQATAQQLSALRGVSLRPGYSWNMTSPSPSLAELHPVVKQSNENESDSLSPPSLEECDPATKQATARIETAMARLGVRGEEEAELIAGWLHSLESTVQASMHEWVEWAGEAKEAMRLRDQRQRDWADLLAMRAKCAAERDFILSGGGGQIEEGGKARHRVSFKIFFQEKLDQMRGIDPLTSKQNRLARLEAAMAGYRQALEGAQSQSEAIDARLEGEMAHWTLQLQQEWQQEILPLHQRLLREYSVATQGLWQ